MEKLLKYRAPYQNTQKERRQTNLEMKEVINKKTDQKLLSTNKISRRMNASSDIYEQKLANIINAFKNPRIPVRALDSLE